MSQTVANILVDVLEKIGVEHIFGLIADSLNPIGDAVRQSKIEWIGVRHEEGGALAAAGQAKLTGRFLPRESVVIQVDERPHVIGRRAPTELGVIGSVRPTLTSLIDRVKPKSNHSFFDTVATQRKAWNDMQDKQADPMRSKDRIHPQAVARMVSDLAKRDTVFVIDTGLNTPWSGNWIRQSGQQRIIGSFNNGAVGTALGQANGIQALDRSRQVIALCGDGGFNMLMCEFLTAVQHKLPVKVVVYNNSSLGLIRLEAESMGLPAWKAMDFPNPDYVALAHACGAVGFKAEKPGELREAIDQALKADGPAS